MKKSRYSMTYFHLGDLLPVYSGVMTKEDYENYFNAPGTITARYTRYIKSNIGVGGNKKKLFKLLGTMNFNSILEAEKIINWTNAPVINL